MYSRPSGGPSGGGMSAPQQVPVYSTSSTSSSVPSGGQSGGGYSHSSSYFGSGGVSMYAQPRQQQVPVYSSSNNDCDPCCQPGRSTCVIL